MDTVTPPWRISASTECLRLQLLLLSTARSVLRHLLLFEWLATFAGNFVTVDVTTTYKWTTPEHHQSVNNLQYCIVLYPSSTLPHLIKISVLLIFLGNMGRVNVASPKMRIKRPSTVCQQYVNSASTEHQQRIKGASTEHQPSINRRNEITICHLCGLLPPQPILGWWRAIVAHMITVDVITPTNVRQQSVNRASTERQQSVNNFSYCIIKKSQDKAIVPSNNQRIAELDGQSWYSEWCYTWNECNGRVNDVSGCILYNWRAGMWPLYIGVILHISMVNISNVNVTTTRNEPQLRLNRAKIILISALLIIWGIC